MMHYRGPFTQQKQECEPTSNDDKKLSVFIFHPPRAPKTYEHMAMSYSLGQKKYFVSLSPSHYPVRWYHVDGIFDLYSDIMSRPNCSLVVYTFSNITERSLIGIHYKLKSFLQNKEVKDSLFRDGDFHKESGDIECFIPIPNRLSRSMINGFSCDTMEQQEIQQFLLDFFSAVDLKSTEDLLKKRAEKDGEKITKSGSYDDDTTVSYLFSQIQKQPHYAKALGLLELNPHKEDYEKATKNIYKQRNRWSIRRSLGYKKDMLYVRQLIVASLFLLLRLMKSNNGLTNSLITSLFSDLRSENPSLTEHFNDVKTEFLRLKSDDNDSAIRKRKYVYKGCACMGCNCCCDVTPTSSNFKSIISPKHNCTSIVLALLEAGGLCTDLSFSPVWMMVFSHILSALTAGVLAGEIARFCASSFRHDIIDGILGLMSVIASIGTLALNYKIQFRSSIISVQKKEKSDLDQQDHPETEMAIPSDSFFRHHLIDNILGFIFTLALNFQCWFWSSRITVQRHIQQQVNPETEAAIPSWFFSNVLFLGYFKKNYVPLQSALLAHTLINTSCIPIHASIYFIHAYSSHLFFPVQKGDESEFFIAFGLFSICSFVIFFANMLISLFSNWAIGCVRPNGVQNLFDRSLSLQQKYFKKCNDCLWLEKKEYSSPAEFTFLAKLEQLGLFLEKINGDGNCLYNAMGLYIGKDAQSIRNILADNLEHNRAGNEHIVSGLLREKTYEDYVNGIRRGEWGDDLEICSLMQLLDRAILVVRPDGRIEHRNAIHTYSNDPIFVFYNGDNHYDGFTRSPNLSGRQIYEQLTQVEVVRVNSCTFPARI